MATAAQIGQAVANRTNALAKLRSKILWYDAKITAGLDRTIDQRLTFVATILRDRAKRNVSIPVLTGTGPRGGRVVLARSQPGEFPRMEFRFLRNTVFMDRPTRTSARFGTPLLYGLLLEIGTSQMAKRPWLVRTLDQERSRIISILTAPITSLPGVPQPSPTFVASNASNNPDFSGPV